MRCDPRYIPRRGHKPSDLFHLHLPTRRAYLDLLQAESDRWEIQDPCLGVSHHAMRELGHWPPQEGGN